jgi:hypothetical protein
MSIKLLQKKKNSRRFYLIDKDLSCLTVKDSLQQMMFTTRHLPEIIRTQLTITSPYVQRRTQPGVKKSAKEQTANSLRQPP